MALLKSILAKFGLDTRVLYQALSAASLRAAVREQNLGGLMADLERIVPDTTDQYTSSFDPAEFARYWHLKMRALHAFQVRCALDALDHTPGTGLSVIDIGDSSGTHGTYVRALAPEGKIGRFISVNLDPVAVEKVRAKGGEAVLCRAEALPSQNIHPDLYLCFETLEHLTDPLRFLHELSAKTESHGILFSVPYRRTSRFGGNALRGGDPTRELTPEAVHIFELCPADWQLLAELAGFRCVFTRTYRQYPRFGLLRLLAPLWRRLDFEGFVAFYLERDTSLSNRYTGW